MKTQSTCEYLGCVRLYGHSGPHRTEAALCLRVKRCTVRPVQGYRGPRGRVPKWEVFAPPGRKFLDGPHSVYVWTLKEAEKQAGQPTTECLDPECDCKEEGTNE